MIAGDRNAWCFPEMVKAINAATVNSKIYDFGEPNEVNGNIMIGTDKKLFAANKYLRVRTTNAESNTSGVLKVEVKTADSLTSGGTALNNPEVIYSSRQFAYTEITANKTLIDTIIDHGAKRYLQVVFSGHASNVAKIFAEVSSIEQ